MKTVGTVHLKIFLYFGNEKNLFKLDPSKMAWHGFLALNVDVGTLAFLSLCKFVEIISVDALNVDPSFGLSFEQINDGVPNGGRNIFFLYKEEN